jgi:hypothetical protein
MGAAAQQCQPSAGGTTVKIDAAVKTCCPDLSQYRRSRKKRLEETVVSGNCKYFIEIWVVNQHFTVWRLNQNRNSQVGPPCLQSCKERGREDGVSQRAQTNEKNAGLRRQAWEQIGRGHAEDSNTDSESSSSVRSTCSAVVILHLLGTSQKRSANFALLLVFVYAFG